MRKIQTYEDGWECVPELKDISDNLAQLREYTYEIDNCQRETDLEDMVYEMRSICQSTIEMLDEIDTEQEFETIEAEDDDDDYRKGGEISEDTFEEISEHYDIPMKALKSYAKSHKLKDKDLEDRVATHYLGEYESDAEMAEFNNLEHHLDENHMFEPEMYSIYGDNSYFTEFNFDMDRE